MEFPGAGPATQGTRSGGTAATDRGKVGLTGYTGAYLTGTSSFFSSEDSAAQYGIFSWNAAGPAGWNQIYGSNMNDSGMYVGACHQVCDVTIDHAWMENNALGYSGTNSGGAVVIENWQFDDNEDGVDTNTQIAGDPLPPHDGACPGGATSTITHTHSCWVFIHNDVHDNNNGNVPEAGNAAAGPIGTGMTLSGGRNDTVMDNTFSNNGAWGILFGPYPTAARRPCIRSAPTSAGSRSVGSAVSSRPRGTLSRATHSSMMGISGIPRMPTSARSCFTRVCPAIATPTTTRRTAAPHPTSNSCSPPAG